MTHIKILPPLQTINYPSHHDDEKPAPDASHDDHDDTHHTAISSFGSSSDEDRILLHIARILSGLIIEGMHRRNTLRRLGKWLRAICLRVENVCPLTI